MCLRYAFARQLAQLAWWHSSSCKQLAYLPLRLLTNAILHFVAMLLNMCLLLLSARRHASSVKGAPYWRNTDVLWKQEFKSATRRVSPIRETQWLHARETQCLHARHRERLLSTLIAKANLSTAIPSTSTCCSP